MPKRSVRKTVNSSSKNNLFFTIVVLSSAIVIGLSLWIMGANASVFKTKDNWCSSVHTASSQPPAKLKTSTDYFEKGNYQYDTGDCAGAVESYTKAIRLNPKYAEAYNNRAYTYMRMGDYKNALTDLDSAIKIRPTYVNALMNRGDIYNYYYNQNKEKAIADYDKVISQGPEAIKGESVCGHRLEAVYNHNLLLAFWHYFTKTNAPGCF